MCAPLIVAGALYAGGASLGMAAAVGAGTFVAGKLAEKAMKPSSSSAAERPTEVLTPPTDTTIPVTAPATPEISSPLTKQANGSRTITNTIVPLPQVQDFSVQNVRDRSRRSRARKRASSSTVATGGQGLTSPVPTGTKSLFGQ